MNLVRSASSPSKNKPDKHRKSLFIKNKLSSRSSSAQNSEEKKKRRKEAKTKILEVLRDLKTAENAVPEETFIEMNYLLEKDNFTISTDGLDIIKRLESLGHNMENLRDSVEVEDDSQSDFPESIAEEDEIQMEEELKKEEDKIKNTKNKGCEESLKNIDFNVIQERSLRIDTFSKEKTPIYKTKITTFNDVEKFSTHLNEERYKKNPDVRFKSITFAICKCFKELNPLFEDHILHEINQIDNPDLRFFYDYLMDEKLHNEPFSIRTIPHPDFSELKFENNALLRLSICHKQLLNILLKIFQHLIKSEKWGFSLKYGKIRPPHIVVPSTGVVVPGDKEDLSKRYTHTHVEKFLEECTCPIGAKILNNLMLSYKCNTYDAQYYIQDFTDIQDITIIPLMQSAFFPLVECNNKSAFRIFEEEKCCLLEYQREDFYQSINKFFDEGQGMAVTSIDTEVYHHNSGTQNTDCKISMAYTTIDLGFSGSETLFEERQSKPFSRLVSKGDRRQISFKFAKAENNGYEIMTNFFKKAYFLPEANLILTNLTLHDNLEIKTEVILEYGNSTILGLYLLLSTLVPNASQLVNRHIEQFMKEAKAHNLELKVRNILKKQKMI